MRTLTIKVPGAIPHELSPNFQPKIRPQAWVGLRSRAITEFKRCVYLAAVDARNKWDYAHGQPWQPLEKAVIEVTIIKRGRQPDADNLLASLKHGIDMLTLPKPPRRQVDPMGIVVTSGGKTGASIIKDDGPSCLTWGKVEQRPPKEGEWEPVIILTVREARNEETL